MAERDHYTCRLSWSAEDNEHVATCAEFPGLSWLDEDGVEALRGIKKLVRETVEDLRASGEPVPQPLADKEFSGRFVVRIPPEQHRALRLTPLAGRSPPQRARTILTASGATMKAIVTRRSKPTVRRPGHTSSRRGPRSGKWLRPSQCHLMRST